MQTSILAVHYSEAAATEAARVVMDLNLETTARAVGVAVAAAATSKIRRDLGPGIQGVGGER